MSDESRKELDKALTQWDKLPASERKRFAHKQAEADERMWRSQGKAEKKQRKKVARKR